MAWLFFLFANRLCCLQAASLDWNRIGSQMYDPNGVNQSNRSQWMPPLPPPPSSSYSSYHHQNPSFHGGGGHGHAPAHPNQGNQNFSMDGAAGGGGASFRRCAGDGMRDGWADRSTDRSNDRVVWNVRRDIPQLLLPQTGRSCRVFSANSQDVRK